MTNMGRRVEKHFVYLLSLVLFLLGISMVAISLVLPSGIISSLAQTLGLSMLPAAIVAFILEYYLQRRWTDQLLQVLTRNISIVSQEMGITRIYRNRDEWDKEELLLWESANNIRYLAVTPNMKGGGEFMVETVTRLLRKGVSFQFLVCHPAHPFVTQYYGANPTDAVMAPFREQIWDSIKRLQLIQTSAQGTLGKIEFRIYDMSPGCYMQIIDKSVFCQPYFYGNSGHKPFMMQVDSESIQREIMIEHFYAIWKNAIKSDDFFKHEKKSSDSSQAKFA